MIKNKLFKIIISTLSLCFVTAIVGCKNNDTSGYDVTYCAGDGHTINGVKEYVVKNTKKIELEPTPDVIKDDTDVFEGWYKRNDFTGDIVKFPLEVTSSVKLYAKYHKISTNFKVVNFNAGEDATPVNKYILGDDEQIKIAPTTSKTNYKFLGWFENQQSENPVTFPYTPTEKITTLIAKWKKTAFKVKYHTVGTMPEGCKITSTKDVYESKNEIEKILVAPNTTDSNSTFAGWYSSAEYKINDLIQFPYTVKENDEMYARFTNNGKTVTLKDGETTEYIKNCTIIPYEPKPITSKEGYDFKGWKIGESANIIDFKDPLQISNDTTLLAVWEEKTDFTISLKNTSIAEDKITLKKDTLLEKQGIVRSKDHFTFVDWYKDSDFKNPVVFPYKITQDETFFAKFVRSTVDIEIVNSEDTSTTLKQFASVSVSSFGQPDVSVPGRISDYTLDKYASSDGAVNPVKFPLDTNENLESIIVDNKLVLKAIWKNRNYHIVLNYGDGASETVVNKVDKQLKASALPTISKPNKKIVSWTDGTTTYTGDTLIPLKEMELTANWEDTASKIIVTRVNPITSEESEYTIASFPIDGKLKDVPHLDYANYTLNGFYINGSSTLTTNMDTSVPKEATLKEGWVQTTATINIDYGDGITKTLVNQPTSFKPCDLPKVSKTDYQMSKFKVRGTETTYDVDSEEVINITSDTLNLDVVWTQNAFVVTYVFVHEDGVKETLFVENHVKQLSSYVPSITGYTFKGWYDNVNFTGDPYVEGTTITKDVELFAKCEKQSGTYTATFSLAGSQVIDAKFDNESSDVKVKSKVFNENTTLSYDEFPVCSCKGNAFLGWYENETSTTPITKITENKTVYARWQPLAEYVTVCLNVDDGKFLVYDKKGTIIFDNNSILMTVKQNTKWGDFKNDILSPTYDDDGYTLKHWSDKKGSTEGLSDDYVIDKNVFLYAVTQKKEPDPKDFKTDSWYTIKKVSTDGVIPEGESERIYGLEALKYVYPALASDTLPIDDSLIRNAKFDGVTYQVRVVGREQDILTEDNSKKASLTFEFCDCIHSLVVPNSSYWATFGATFQENGYIYGKMQQSLTDSIVKVDKTTNSTSDTTTNSYFIISSKENSYGSSGNRYEYYKQDNTSGHGFVKKYLNSTDCSNYWCRDNNGYNTTLVMMKCTKFGTIETCVYTKANATNAVGRAVSPMFCIA